MFIRVALSGYAVDYQPIPLSAKDNESNPSNKSNLLDAASEFRPISMQCLLHPLLFVQSPIFLLSLISLKTIYHSLKALSIFFVYFENKLWYSAFMEVKTMNIHERLKQLRDELNLTTRAFGAAINMSGGAITNMEKGTRNITERTIRDICREYDVNFDWLTNGIEPMFTDVTSELDINDEVKQLAQQYSLLNDSDRELVKKMINSLAEKSKSP